jgi:hypothetical protein
MFMATIPEDLKKRELYLGTGTVTVDVEYVCGATRYNHHNKHLI